jgi:hypothetical protein
MTTACPWSAEAALAPLLQHTQGFFPAYVMWSGQQTDSPLLYHMLAGLSLLSSVFPPDWVLRDFPGSPINGNLYCLVTGRQGTDRKTTALDFAGELFDEALGGYRFQPPGSVQAFVDAFDTNKSGRRQNFWISEEFSELLAMTQRGRGGNPLTAIKHAMLTAYDGKPLGNSTRKHGQVYCPNPRLTILAAINLALLGDHTDAADHEGGLLSRFNFGYAHRERYFADDRVIPPELQRSLDDNRRFFVSFLTNARACDKANWGRYCGMTQAARYVLAAFGRAIEETTPTGRRARVWGARARSARQAIKIAALLTFGNMQGWDRQSWRIELPEVMAAIGIVSSCYAGSVAVASAISDDLDQRLRVRVVDAIGPTFTPNRDVLRESGLLFRRYNEVISTLSTEGTILTITSPVEEAGRVLEVGYRLTNPQRGVAGSLSAMHSVESVRLLYPGILVSILNDRDAPLDVRNAVLQAGDPIPVFQDFNRVALVGGGDTSTYPSRKPAPVEPSNGNGTASQTTGILFDRALFVDPEQVSEDEGNWQTDYGEDFWRGEAAD